MLAKRHPLPAADAVGFDDETHTYSIDGAVVPRSCTTVVYDLFPRFKPKKTINLYFENWKASGKSKYKAVIDTSFTDDEAKLEIAALWARSTEARDLGSLAHKQIENLLNGVPVDSEARAPVEDEVAGVERWLQECGLRAFRTELPVLARAPDGTPVLAGMLDALFQDAEGQFVLVDWKRTSKPFGHKEWSFRRHGHGPAIRLDDTKWMRYSVQLALYASMLRETAGIDVGDRRLLVRLTKTGAEPIEANTSLEVEQAAAAALQRLKDGAAQVLLPGEGSSEDEEW